MVKISCEGETSLEVLSHLKGFATLIGPEVKAITGTMPEDIVRQANPTYALVGTPASGTTPVAPSENSVPAPAPTQAPLAGQAAPAGYPMPPAPGPAPIVATTPAPSKPVASATPPTPLSNPLPPVAGTQPVFTHEQVGKAGADLVAANPAMMPTLMGLLQRYGVQLVTGLKPEQLGSFAGELRALGAKI